MLSTNRQSIIDWRRRTAKALPRSSIRLKPRSPSPRKSTPLRRARKRMKRNGARTKAWDKVWLWLKPKLEAVGRTRCEFDFLEHNCRGPLDPAHSKKRGKMQGNDIYAVAMACRNVHNILDGIDIYAPLDRRFTHEEMEANVLFAIEQHGGMILR